MLLDVGRHFFAVPFILKLLDLLAMHKLNVFHWHLTEDQGWRVEVKALPRLTEFGAWRGGSADRYGGLYSQAWSSRAQIAVKTCARCPCPAASRLCSKGLQRCWRQMRQFSQFVINTTAAESDAVGVLMCEDACLPAGGHSAGGGVRGAALHHGGTRGRAPRPLPRRARLLPAAQLHRRCARCAVRLWYPERRVLRRCGIVSQPVVLQCISHSCILS